MLIETDSLVLDDLKTQMNRELKWMDLAARFLDKAKVPGQGGKYSVQAGDPFFK